MVVNLSEEYSLLCNWIAEIRDEEIQKDRMRFRRNLERIGEVAAYEISKTLFFEEKEVQTPLGIAITKQLKDQPVIATILRAGLPLHQGIRTILTRRITRSSQPIANISPTAVLRSACTMFPAPSWKVA